jgi:transposase
MTMMGRQGEDEAKLFYEFCLEDWVPADHLLRRIDRFLELSALRQELAPFYSPIGRPSIDPELMIRMPIVGYCLGILSERRLCEEVHLNLAYSWFAGSGLTARCRTSRFSHSARPTSMSQNPRTGHCPPRSMQTLQVAGVTTQQ